MGRHKEPAFQPGVDMAPQRCWILRGYEHLPYCLLTNLGEVGIIFSLKKSGLREVKTLSPGHTALQLCGIQTETYQAQGSFWIKDTDTYLGSMFQIQLQVTMEADRHITESHTHSELLGE